MGFDGVVRGIGDYGNSFGVPIVGEVYFDPVYQVNPLVNAMSVGLVDSARIISAKAGGPGNPVYIVGSSERTASRAPVCFKDITEDSAACRLFRWRPVPGKVPSRPPSSWPAVRRCRHAGHGAAGITLHLRDEWRRRGRGIRLTWRLRQADMEPFGSCSARARSACSVVKKGREAEIEPFSTRGPARRDWRRDRGQHLRHFGGESR